MHPKLRMLQVVLWFLLLCVSSLSQAQVEQFVEGQHYFSLKQVQPQQTGTKIEVLEMFSYACPHCGQVAPAVKAWESARPAQAQLRLLPVVWQKPAWPEYAAVFFAAQKLGVLDKSHLALFDLMYVQNKPPQNLEEVGAFFEQFGIKKEVFKQTMESPEINAMLQDAAKVGGNYEIEGTPSFVVAGRWRFDVGTAGGMDRIGPLINFLVSKALVAQAKK